MNDAERLREGLLTLIMLIEEICEQDWDKIPQVELRRRLAGAIKLALRVAV